MFRRELTRVLILGAVLLTACLIPLSTSPSAKEEFPNRTIELIVVYPPGGTTDLICREVAEAGKNDLGQPVIVVNKTGGGGAVGTGYVYNARPDGYTLGGAAIAGMTLRPHFYKVPYEVSRITPVIQLGLYPNALVVRKDAPWNSLQELLDHAKNNPGKIKFATSAVNDVNHLMLQQLARIHGIKWECVPTTGDAPAITMLLGGHITFVASAGAWLPHVQAGTLKLLVTYGGAGRVYANVPNIKELGYDFITETGPIIIGPPEMPGPIVKKIHDTFKKIIDEPRFEESLKRIGVMKAYRNSEELGQFLASQHKYWGNVVREMGIKKQD